MLVVGWLNLFNVLSNLYGLFNVKNLNIFLTSNKYILNVIVPTDKCIVCHSDLKCIVDITNSYCW